MPNHCDQQVHIHGPVALVKEIYQHLTAAEPIFCEFIVPMPDNIFRGNLGDEERKKCLEEGIPNWYDWCLKNWDTKWDVADVQITDPIKIEFGGKAHFTFNCWTAWSPPIPVWAKLHSMGVSVDADYQDEGGMFEGTWLNGTGESWEPEYEQEDA